MEKSTTSLNDTRQRRVTWCVGCECLRNGPRNSDAPRESTNRSNTWEIWGEEINTGTFQWAMFRREWSIIRKRACHRSCWGRSERLAKRTADTESPWWRCRQRCVRTASRCTPDRCRGWVESSSPKLSSLCRGNSARTTASRHSTPGFCCEARLRCPCSGIIRRNYNRELVLRFIMESL